MSATQSVRAINKGTDDFTAMYDGITYKIPVGSELIIPWDAASLWLGDPRLWDSETDRARAKEYERLRVRWGAIEGIDLDDRLPSIEIHRLSDGAVVPMLGEDPKAQPLNVFGDGAEEDMSQEQRVSHLESQLAAAIERLNNLTAGQVSASPNTQPPSPAVIDQPTVSNDESDELPTDGDDNPPVPVGVPTSPSTTSAPSASEALKAEIAARRNEG